MKKKMEMVTMITTDVTNVEEMNSVQRLIRRRLES